MTRQFRLQAFQSSPARIVPVPQPDLMKTRNSLQDCCGNSQGRISENGAGKRKAWEGCGQFMLGTWGPANSPEEIVRTLAMLSAHRRATNKHNPRKPKHGCRKAGYQKLIAHSWTPPTCSLIGPENADP